MNILKKPIVTEKLTNESEKFNRYGFVVDKRANKIQIKKEVEVLYKVTVDSVKTMNYAGKSRTKYTKSGVISGKTNSYKKAIVKLASGETIDFFSNI